MTTSPSRRAARRRVQGALAGALLAATAAACTTRDGGASTDRAAVGGAADRSDVPAGAAARRAGVTVTAAQRARLHLVTVQPRPYRPVVQTTGTVAFNGDRSTPVLSEVSGPALRVLVNPGAVVARGDPLATVSSPDFASAVAQLRKAQSAYRNLARIASLDAQLFTNDALARRELEQAQTDAAAAAADRDAAIQQMRALGVSGAQLDAIVDGRSAAPLVATIRAPIAGTVVEKLVSAGQLLTAGTTQTFTVADLSTMWVQASVFPDDLRHVAVGEAADVLTDASPTPLAGRVEYIAALVDSGSKAVSVRVVVPNRGQVLRQGMFVRVAIHAAREATGILVPAAAVLRDEQNLPFVFVAAPDGAFLRRPVTLGPQLGTEYVVQTGLAPGEVVVGDGAVFLQFAETQ